MQPLQSQLTDLQKWLLDHGREFLNLPADNWKHLTQAQRSLLEQQRTLRARSRSRFPSPDLWLWSDRSLAQASDWLSACFKASLFPQQVAVLDGCCGAGVDAVALAARGPVHAVDCNPWMTALAASNATAHGRSLTASITELDADALCDAQWMHVDPDRRPGDRKTLVADQFSPSLYEVLCLAELTRGCVVKLAPSTLYDSDLAKSINERCVRVWLGSHAECRQQLLLCKEAQDGLMRRLELRESLCQRHAIAVLLSVRLDQTNQASTQPQSLYFAANAMQESISGKSEVDDYVFDLHSTLHAAGLSMAWAQQQNLQPISNEHGYFTGPQPVLSPWTQCFEVLDVLAWDDRKVRKWLKQSQVGLVEVKCRLINLNASEYQRRYSRREGRPVTLLVTQVGDRVRAVVAQRVVNC